MRKGGTTEVHELAHGNTNAKPGIFSVYTAAHISQNKTKHHNQNINADSQWNI